MNYLLSVGINHYKTPGNDLRGCINDVLNIRKTLAENCGFSYVAMKYLIDQQATKNNILNALKNMIRLAVKGDHLIYHHSSHGSQISDQSGDEIDGLDEILCPYDFDWDGNYITDDELRQIICGLKKGVILDVVLDACHTGTALREIDPLKIPKFIQPIHTPAIPKVKEMLVGGLPANVILWAGCDSTETSADAYINGSYNGALTYFFCQEIRKNGGKVSRAKLYNNMKKEMKNAHYDQTPQLECGLWSRYRRMF